MDHISELCLSWSSLSVARLWPTSALEYLLKTPYFIQVYSNVAGFLTFEAVFWAGRQHCPMSEKKS